MSSEIREFTLKIIQFQVKQSSLLEST